MVLNLREKSFELVTVVKIDFVFTIKYNFRGFHGHVGPFLFINLFVSSLIVIRGVLSIIEYL